MATTSPSDSAGGGTFPRRFSDRYILLKELGRGGMGQVYMGMTGEGGAHRVCALKIIRDISNDRDPAELKARFLDEAKIVTKLSHENLVFVFDYGVVGSQGYLAMEFVEGKTLTELWNRCALRSIGFPVGLSLFIVSELCAGLGYAHRTGDLRLVHRDVSPSNVMLSYTGGVKLIDFGLAKWRSKISETASGINWGKVSYMSPEQHLGKTIDHRSDLFSAGLIIWELLTGRQIFPNAEARTGEIDIPPPSAFNPHIPADLDATIMKALAAEPSDRYQSGEEMSAALAAHMPREAGKLSLSEFVRSLFESEVGSEAEERERILSGSGTAAALAAPAGGTGQDEGLLPGDGRDPLLGQVLAERYFVRRLIGEGAMGRVYEGHHTGIGKRVAIKIPRHGERRKSELLQRFRLEAQAASQIRHPNIADVTDCGSTPDGRFFFVMEFVDGIDLGHLVRRQEVLSVERAMLIAVQVCRAIEAAHKAGIIHRDLKPSNVMLVRDRADDHEREAEDFVKVLDFGVAKFLRADVGANGTDLGHTDAAVGTPKYMAPEQIERGNDIDFRVYIYAAGGLLYFMLSGGHAPIEGDTVENVWRKKVTEEATPLRRWRSDLPPAVESLVMRCLSRDPGGRPPNMEALRKEILGSIERMRQVPVNVLSRTGSSTSMIDGEHRLHRPAGPQLSEPVKSSRRNRAAALVLVTGAGIFAAVALLLDRAAGPGASGVPVATERLVSASSGDQAASPPAPGPATAPAPATAPPEPALPTSPATTAGRALPATTKITTTAANSASATSRPPTRIVNVTAPRPARAALAAPNVRRPAASSGVAESPERWLADAEVGFQEARYFDAEKLARRAEAAGATVDAAVILGKIYRTTGEYQQALDTYEQALKLAPQDSRLLAGRNKALTGLGAGPRSAR